MAVVGKFYREGDYIVVISELVVDGKKIALTSALKRVNDNTYEGVHPDLVDTNLIKEAYYATRDV